MAAKDCDDSGAMKETEEGPATKIEIEGGETVVDGRKSRRAGSVFKWLRVSDDDDDLQCPTNCLPSFLS